MLQIDKINFGLIPFGPAIGQRAISISFKNNEEIYDKDKDHLYEEFRKLIKKNYEKQFITAIDGSLQTFLVFDGEECIANINTEQWQEFFTCLTKESLEVQKILKLTPDKLRPPYCIWRGTPQEFSSNRYGNGDVYQYFNNCIAIINDKKRNDLGLQQLINHQFSTVCVIINKDSDKRKITDLTKKFNVTRKLNIIDNTEDDELQKYCLEKSYRYYKLLQGEYFI